MGDIGGKTRLISLNIILFKVKTMKIILVWVVCIFFIFPDFAEAYIRPGGGSDFVQMLISSFLSIVAFLKAIPNKFISIFRKNK